MPCPSQTSGFNVPNYVRWIGRAGRITSSPRSPDLTPLDFFLWEFVKDCGLHTIQMVTPEMLSRVHEEMVRRLHLCILWGGGHVENSPESQTLNLVLLGSLCATSQLCPYGPSNAVVCVFVKQIETLLGLAEDERRLSIVYTRRFLLCGASPLAMKRAKTAQLLDFTEGRTEAGGGKPGCDVGKRTTVPVRKYDSILKALLSLEKANIFLERTILTSSLLHTRPRFCVENGWMFSSRGGGSEVH
ncbi:hypothetical protein ANN_05781 [Periplaneta americana]|uniref:Uncharacterized protein n=1 Tax=Periplaneta americana TaxID=6978 RepID=A0ABQ8TDL2_PERAM|nr:hypothetical protein ANN_05781 [Periplaneta americana]